MLESLLKDLYPCIFKHLCDLDLVLLSRVSKFLHNIIIKTDVRLWLWTGRLQQYMEENDMKALEWRFAVPFRCYEAEIIQTVISDCNISWIERARTIIYHAKEHYPDGGLFGSGYKKRDQIEEYGKTLIEEFKTIRQANYKGFKTHYYTRAKEARKLLK